MFDERYEQQDWLVARLRLAHLRRSAGGGHRAALGRVAPACAAGHAHARPPTRCVPPALASRSLLDGDSLQALAELPRLTATAWMRLHGEPGRDFMIERALPLRACAVCGAQVPNDPAHHRCGGCAAVWWCCPISGRGCRRAHAAAHARECISNRATIEAEEGMGQEEEEGPEPHQQQAAGGMPPFVMGPSYASLMDQVLRLEGSAASALRFRDRRHRVARVGRLLCVFSFGATFAVMPQ